MISEVPNLSWYAVRVRSNFEKVTAAHLSAQSLETFLPTCRVRRRWADRMKEIDQPLFPGYVFCRFDRLVPLSVLMAPGVVHIVSAGNTPIAVDEHELAAVRRLVESGSNPLPYPFLRAGDTIRIRYGPLAGLEGLLLEVKGNWRIVVSISLLQRSVMAEIDYDGVERLPSLPPRLHPVPSRCV